MAVYERTYRGYAGALTAEWSRFLVLPRYAFQQVFSSKLFIVFLVLCFIFPLICAVAIYLPHNLNFLKLFQIDPADIMQGIEDTLFPRMFIWIQGIFLSFLMVFIVGPALISADMRNNALPLYLARPFSRAEYVLGKMSVLMILLSAITWVPGLLLFLFQSYLMGTKWFVDHLRIGIGLFVGSWIWILVLSLLALSVSAYVKWKPVARILLFGMFPLLAAFGGMINLTLGIQWGWMLNLSQMVLVVWYNLLAYRPPMDFPVGAAWVSLIGACAICLLLLARKVRAYEVVRS